MKRVFIIHGWGGFPGEGWFPWLKKELKDRGFIVNVPQMPNSENPKMNSWIPYLKKVVGKPDEDTYFIGHSIGCQTILRYLESLEENQKIGGVVLVAGFVRLNLDAIEEEEEGSSEKVKPWLETPLNWNKIKLHTKKFISIFSDNDPFVPLENKKVFQEALNPRIIIENKKGHFSGSEGIKKLPSAVTSVLELSKWL